MPYVARNRWLWLITVALLTGCHGHRSGSLAGPLARMQCVEASAPTDTGLSAQWFGVSTLLIRDKETSIMIDGFFSRPDRTKILFSRIGPAEDVIRDTLRVGGVAELDALFVSHSHYDHALDAPFVAKETGALLFGSESTLNVVRAAGMTSEQLHPLRHAERVKIGKFEIQSYRTPHAPTIFRGAIDESFDEPARFYDYKLGANYSFLLRHPKGSILVIPTAGSRKDMLKGVEADIVFLAIGALGKQQHEQITAYWNEAVVKTGAKLVIPVHWDDFTRPFAEPLRPFPWPFDNVDRSLGALADLASSAGAPTVQLKLMPLNKPVSLARAALREQAVVGVCLSPPAS